MCVVDVYIYVCVCVYILPLNLFLVGISHKIKQTTFFFLIFVDILFKQNTGRRAAGGGESRQENQGRAGERQGKDGQGKKAPPCDWMVWCFGVYQGQKKHRCVFFSSLTG